MLRKLIKIAKWVFGIVIGLMTSITLLLLIYEDDIKQYAVSKLNEHLKTKVEVKNIELVFWSTFPYASLEFNDVLIRDAFPNNTSKDTLFYGEKVYLKFSLTDVWNDNYSVTQATVNNGLLHLKTNEEGAVNYDILKEQKDTSDGSFEFELEDVTLSHVRLKYSDRKKQQFYHLNAHKTELSGAFSEEIYDMELQGAFFVEKIQQGAVPFISQQESQLGLKLNIDNNIEKYTITDGKLSIGSMNFIADGMMLNDSLSLHLAGDQIGIEDFVKTFQDESIAQTQKYQGAGLLNFDLQLEYDSTMKSADVVAIFDIKNGSLSLPDQSVSMKNLLLSGSYRNFGGTKDDVLEIDNLSGNTLNGGISGQMTLVNSLQPQIKTHLDGTLDLHILHQLFFPQIAQSMAGIIATELNLDLRWDDNNQPQIHDVKANVHCNQVSIALDQLPHPLHHLSGDFSMNNENLRFSNVDVQYASSDFSGSGTMQNLLSAIRYEKTLNISTKIKSNRIKVEDFYAVSSDSESSTEHIFPQNVKLTAQTQVAVLESAGHQYQNVNTALVMSEKELYFYSLSLQHSGGLIRGNVKVKEHSDQPFELIAHLRLSGLNTKKLFQEWNNFGQSTLLSENISGDIDANIELYLPISRGGAPVMPALEANADVTLKNGGLKNLSSFKSITDYMREQKTVNLFMKKHINYLEKELMDVRFNTLSQKFIIKDEKLTLPKMHISSSILDLNISGTHGFNNIVDYALDFRFRELKASKEESEFGSIEDDGTGVKIYMKMFGHIDDLQFSMDKETRKEDRKEKIEEEKTTVKSMLKEDFGMFRKDSTLHKIEKEPEPEPEFEYYDGVFEDSTKNEKKEEKKKGFFKNFVEKSKKDQQKNKEKEVEIDL